MGQVDWPATASLWANLAQVAAIFGALIYFAYRLVIGYLIVNVSLAIGIQRASQSLGKDHLAVAVEVCKGNHGAMVLHDLAGHVSWPGGEASLHFEGLTRLSYEVVEGRARILPDQPDRSAPLLRYPPGEKTVFSAYAVIPAQEPCTVEVTLLGKIMGGMRYGQWRASAISLPGNEA